jgi:hypothetical protein
MEACRKRTFDMCYENQRNLFITAPGVIRFYTVYLRRGCNILNYTWVSVIRVRAEKKKRECLGGNLFSKSSVQRDHTTCLVQQAALIGGRNRDLASVTH